MCRPEQEIVRNRNKLIDIHKNIIEFKKYYFNKTYIGFIKDEANIFVGRIRISSQVFVIDIKPQCSQKKKYFEHCLGRLI